MSTVGWSGLGGARGAAAYQSTSSAKVASEGRNTAATASARSDASPASSATVTLSANAMLTSARESAPSFTDVGMSARKKLDALKQQASDKTHTPVNKINVQQAGLLDYSGFSDQELAAMAKNSSKNFSEAERDAAQGMLADRVKVSVEAFAGPAVAGDWRAHGMAINALYETMSPEVRSALGWTPAMLAANNRMVQDDENKYGKLDMNDLFTSLRSAQHKGGLVFHRAT